MCACVHIQVHPPTYTNRYTKAPPRTNSYEENVNEREGTREISLGQILNSRSRPLNFLTSNKVEVAETSFQVLNLSTCR